MIYSPNTEIYYILYTQGFSLIYTQRSNFPYSFHSTCFFPSFNSIQFIFLNPLQSITLRYLKASTSSSTSPFKLKFKCSLLNSFHAPVPYSYIQSPSIFLSHISNLFSNCWSSLLNPLKTVSSKCSRDITYLCLKPTFTLTTHSHQILLYAHSILTVKTLYPLK